MPLTLDKIEVHLYFHIFDILNFYLLLGYPLEKLLTPYHGSLDELLRETASSTATSCSENLLAKHSPKQDLLEEMMHTSPFVSSEPILSEITLSPKEYGQEDTLRFCEDE